MLTVVPDDCPGQPGAEDAAFAAKRDDSGRRLVGRNGYWFHKTANVLAALPKSAHPGAAYGAKFPKAAAKITDDLDQLLAFYDFPAEHWVHLRTTNPIESSFATVRHPTKLTKGPGSRAAELAMAFKLIQSAQGHWRMVNAPHLVALVRPGTRFERGVLAGRPEQAAA